MNVGNLDFQRRPLAPRHILEHGPTQTTAAIQTDGVQRAALTSPDLANTPSEQNVQKFLKAQYGVSDAELQSLSPRAVLQSHGLTPSQIDEIAAGGPGALQAAANRLILESEGINPNSLSPEQQAKMAMKIQMSRDLGLTPGQVQNVMHVMTMSPMQLENLTAHMDPNGPRMGMAGIQPNLEGGAVHATHFDIAIGPPKPDMSLRGFIGAITEALKKIMLIKASVSEDDARVDMQMLKDTITQTQLKIQFQREQSEKTIAALEASIWAMRFVRIMMYLTLGIVTAIMLAVAIVISVVTFGAAAAPAAAAVAMAIGGLIAAIASTIATVVMIASNELKRTGQFNGASGQRLSDIMLGIMIALEVIAAIAGLITGIYAIIQTLKQLFAVALKTAMQVTLRMIMKAIGQIIAEMIGHLVGALGAIMQARSMTNATTIEATRSAASDYQNSAEHAQVSATQTAELSALNAQLASGQINSASYAAQVERINTAASVQDAVNLGSATRTAIEQAQQNDETLNWIMMGLTIGLSIGSAIAGSLGDTFMKLTLDATEEAIKTFEKQLARINWVQKMIGFFMIFFNALVTGLQGYAQVQMAEVQIDLVRASLNARQMIILLEAFTTMWTAIEEDIEELMKNTQESFANLIKALTEAFDISGRAMDKIMQAF